jgi:hypothetical protein
MTRTAFVARLVVVAALGLLTGLAIGGYPAAVL